MIPESGLNPRYFKMTQLDRIEAMLAELIKEARERRVQQAEADYAKLVRETNAEGETFTEMEREHDQRIRGIRAGERD